MEGHVCLRSLPNTAEKPTLAEVHRAEERELKVLDEFIAYKTRCVERLQNVEKNLQAIEETKWLKEVLEHFLDANREAQRALCSGHMNRTRTEEKTGHWKEKSIGRTSQVLQKLV